MEMSLMSLMPYIDHRTVEPWSPLRSTSELTNRLDQITHVFQSSGIQKFPGKDVRALWDTRTTDDLQFANNVLDDSELQIRTKKKKIPKSIKSLELDSPITDKAFENLQKDIWSATPSSGRRSKEPWRRTYSTLHQRNEDLRHVGHLSQEVSDVPSLTDSATLTSLSVNSPVDIVLEGYEPQISISGLDDGQTESLTHTNWWMDTLPSDNTQLDIESTESLVNNRMEPELVLPKRSNTSPLTGLITTPLRKVRQPRKVRRESWPEPVLSLKRPAFPRKKLQDLQTFITREEFKKELYEFEEEKRAKSKRLLSMLLPLVPPSEAIQWFPLFTKREVNILTELLQEDPKLAASLNTVGISLPLDRERILKLVDAAKTNATSRKGRGRLINELVSERASLDLSTRSPSPASTRNSTEIMLPDTPYGPRGNEPQKLESDVNHEIHKSKETPSHLLPREKVTQKNWNKIVGKLDHRFRYITFAQGVWTLELQSFNRLDIPSIPLHIANAPVLLSYNKQVPQISSSRPQDPLKDSPLPVGCVPNLSDAVLDVLFKTFPKASMACCFMNQRMTIVYDCDFDEGLEQMIRPETFGGYLVSFLGSMPSYTAVPSHFQNDRLLVGKRVDVCRPGNTDGATSCVGVRLHRRTPSNTEPNHAITMTTHAFLAALRLPPVTDSPVSSRDATDVNASITSTVLTDEDFSRLRVYDQSRKAVLGQYYRTFDDLSALRGDMAASKFTYDLALIQSLPTATHQLPVISFQKRKKNEFKKLTWCTSPEMLTQSSGNGKMYLLNSWMPEDSQNPKDGRIVAEGLVIGEAYQNITESQKGMYARSILWRQNFTSKKWQVEQVSGLRERAYRIWNGAPSRRVRLEQHRSVQDNGYSGSPLAVRIDDNRTGEEAYAVFGFQNYAVRCIRPDGDDGFRKSGFPTKGKGKESSVVNQVLMDALDHGAYEFFGAYKLPEQVINEWEIVWDVERNVNGEVVEKLVTDDAETVKTKFSSNSVASSEFNAEFASRGISDRGIETSGRKRDMMRRRSRRSETSSSCIVI